MNPFCFTVQATGANVIKLFCPLFMDFHNMLEYLPWRAFPAYSNKHFSLV
jgi:hypothetical protein